MSITGYWVVMPVPASVIDEVVPVLGPLIAAQAASDAGRRGLERWLRGGLDLPDVLELHDLAAPYLLDDHLDLLFEVWGAYEKADRFLKSACRKGYPAIGMAYALGPERFSAVPGWFGDFVLTPHEVRAALPAVEAALALDPAERAAADRRLHELLDEASEENAAALFDDLVPTWRRAADTGQGLIGAQAIPC
ncbi:hypothetical protein ACH4E7_33895 [Kitasatospora sp. NPDC018058]|uniref:hypothetical protein n=1 Tax=Kitasatospora sp. NPDC018058 TaxID=3364025 RepID=UPI0037C13C6D